MNTNQQPSWREPESAHEQLRYYNQMHKKYIKTCLTYYVIVLSFTCSIAIAAFGGSRGMSMDVTSTIAFVTASVAVFMFLICWSNLTEIDKGTSKQNCYSLWALWLRPRGRLKVRIDEATKRHTTHINPSYREEHPYAFSNPYVNGVVYDHKKAQCRKRMLACWLITLVCIYFLGGILTFLFFASVTLGLCIHGWQEANPT